MSKKSKKSKEFDPGVLQISELPLAKRSKKEEGQFEKLQKVKRELNKDAWIKTVKLMKGKWRPFPPHHRCFVQSDARSKWGVGGNQVLLLQFKRAMLSQNWQNAVKLALAIFQNYYMAHDRVHLQVFLSLLMNHPQVDDKLLQCAGSYIWQVENKEDMAEAYRCFCSLPKKLPSEITSFNQHRQTLVSTVRKYNAPKTRLQVKYTAHIGKKNVENDMYVE